MHDPLKDAAVDALLKAHADMIHAERAAANARPFDPEVAEALEASAQVQRRMIDTLRAMLTETEG